MDWSENQGANLISNICLDLEKVNLIRRGGNRSGISDFAPACFVVGSKLTSACLGQKVQFLRHRLALSPHLHLGAERILS